MRERDGADLAILRRKLARFVADNEQRLRDADPAALAVDNDRAKDMWEPLLAVADVAGGDWPKRAREAGQALAQESETETAEADVKLVLLADIRDIFAKEPRRRLPRPTCSTLRRRAPGPWPAHLKQAPARGAANARECRSLRGFGVAMGHPMGHREFGDDSRQPVGLANAMRLRWHA